MYQDFTLLFDDKTSSRLLQKWNVFFKSNVIKEANRLIPTSELRRLVQSAESPPGFEAFDIIAVTVASFIVFMTI